MDRRRLGLLVVIAGGAAALVVLGTGLPSSGSPPEPAMTPEASAPPGETLTDAESDWCDRHLNRVANSALWEYMSDGAPFLTEAERLGGPLRLETIVRLVAWRDAHPDQYLTSCRTAFTTWAGRDD